MAFFSLCKSYLNTAKYKKCNVDWIAKALPLSAVPVHVHSFPRTLKHFEQAAIVPLLYSVCNALFNKCILGISGIHLTRNHRMFNQYKWVIETSSSIKFQTFTKNLCHLNKPAPIVWLIASSLKRFFLLFYLLVLVLLVPNYIGVSSFVRRFDAPLPYLPIFAPFHYDLTWIRTSCPLCYTFLFITALFPLKANCQIGLTSFGSLICNVHYILQ